MTEKMKIFLIWVGLLTALWATMAAMIIVGGVQYAWMILSIVSSIIWTAFIWAVISENEESPEQPIPLGPEPPAAEKHIEETELGPRYEMIDLLKKKRLLETI
jgi:hypothetical protein